MGFISQRRREVNGKEAILEGKIRWKIETEGFYCPELLGELEKSLGLECLLREEVFGV